MNRDQMLSTVSRVLGGRQLVWAGLRGDDMDGLRDLPELSASFSLLAESSPARDSRSLGLDEMTGRRVDPEIWDASTHMTDPATKRFRAGLLSILRSPSAIVPYRSSDFLSSIQIARRDTCIMLGLFGGQQSLFEYKPWVETAIESIGIPRVPWRYFAEEDRALARQMPEGEYVIRRSRTSGGEGISRISSLDGLLDAWPEGPDQLVSLAPYIEAIPVNVGATVWSDGVTVHNPSVQLIGIPSAVGREFGHCGNDFAAIKHFPDSTIDEIEASTIEIGNWLRTNGYLGTFGVDYLVTGDDVLFTEVNPRFQGSTRPSSRIDKELGLPCLLLEHVAAWLGVGRPESPRVRERVRYGPSTSSLVVHWTGAEPRHVDVPALVAQVREQAPTARADVLTSPHVVNDPGSTVARLTFDHSLTRTGFDLDPAITSTIDDWRASQFLGPESRIERGAIST